MNKVGVVLVSGACCNPASKPVDEQISAIFRQAATELEVEMVFKTVSIAGAALGGGVGLGQKADDEVRSLISARGIGVLPIVFINGTLAFYGGTPAAEVVRERVKVASTLEP